MKTRVVKPFTNSNFYSVEKLESKLFGLVKYWECHTGRASYDDALIIAERLSESDKEPEVVKEFG